MECNNTNGNSTTKIIDITQELFTSKVHTGNIKPSFEKVKTITNDAYNLTNIHLCTHNGTHVDAPSHFIKNGRSIDKMSLNLFYGNCIVVEFDKIISDKLFIKYISKKAERILFKGNCELEVDTANLITNTDIKLIGVEGQTIGDKKISREIHNILLSKNIVILEGLDLTHVKADKYLLSAFPLKLGSLEGAPVRAVLIKN